MMDPVVILIAIALFVMIEASLLVMLLSSVRRSAGRSRSRAKARRKGTSTTIQPRKRSPSAMPITTLTRPKPQTKKSTKTPYKATNASLRQWLSAEDIYEEQHAWQAGLTQEDDQYNHYGDDWDDTDDDAESRREEYEWRFGQLNRRYERDFSDLQQDLEEHLYNNPPFLHDVQDFEDQIDELRRKYNSDLDDLADELNYNSW